MPRKSFGHIGNAGFGLLPRSFSGEVGQSVQAELQALRDSALPFPSRVWNLFLWPSCWHGPWDESGSQYRGV